jgi:hypothetical protein
MGSLLDEVTEIKLEQNEFLLSLHHWILSREMFVQKLFTILFKISQGQFPGLSFPD